MAGGEGEEGAKKGEGDGTGIIVEIEGLLLSSKNVDATVVVCLILELFIFCSSILFSSINILLHAVVSC